MKKSSKQLFRINKSRFLFNAIHSIVEKTRPVIPTILLFHESNSLSGNKNEEKISYIIIHFLMFRECFNTTPLYNKLKILPN